ncbi:MAG: hypothetical protein IMW89_17445 [Ktedonobacteraceae bacterium]|nr:hypothetical protein [Ktedonobacteraceae bacterium]
MLAYIFWHWPAQQTDITIYQQRLLDFHRVLAAHRSVGFEYSRVLAMQQAPWLERSAITYEDWYIVENSAALDPLDERAVSGPCLEPHNQIARLTENGTGGLYRLRSGAVRPPVVRFAYRFAKPAGMAYTTLYDLLQPFAQQDNGALWQRQLTLGPAPEFCLHGAAEIELPPVLQALEVPVTQLWLSESQES